MPQSLASVLIHLVYSTKHRHPFLPPDLDPELYAYQAAVFADMRCPAVIINGTADHVHALFRLARTVTIADVVEEVKKSSSKWLKTKRPTLAGFQWQVGYGAFSIGESGVPQTRAYIERQKEHHSDRSFQDEYRAILALYQIEFDERYVWD